MLTQNALWLAIAAGVVAVLEQAGFDVNACRPSQGFFCERVWPEVLAGGYGGKRCSDSRH